MTLNNTLFGLTNREKRMLDKSWATQFADKIFPLINEERFSVLYSDKASRPNTPVNVIIGALILKELRNQTDDEVFATSFRVFLIFFACFFASGTPYNSS